MINSSFLENTILASLRNMFECSQAYVRLADGEDEIECLFSQVSISTRIGEDGQMVTDDHTIYIGKSKELAVTENDIIEIYINSEWKKKRIISKFIKANSVVAYVVGNENTRKQGV